MANQDLASKIIQSIEQSDFNWRTKAGIAKELSVSPEEVARTLAESNDFVKSKVPNAKGEELYTTVQTYQQKTPFLKRILGAAANTVVS